MTDFEMYSKKLAKEFDIEVVTVSSYLNSIIEYDGSEQERAKVFRSIKDNQSLLGSYKLSNIKVDINFAIKIVLGVESACSKSKLKLISVLLKLICDLRNIKVELSENESWLVYALFLKGGNGKGVGKSDLLEYMNRHKPENITSDISEADFDNLVENLEKIRSVELKEGRYYLIESLVL